MNSTDNETSENNEYLMYSVPPNSEETLWLLTDEDGNLFLCAYNRRLPEMTKALTFATKALAEEYWSKQSFYEEEDVYTDNKQWDTKIAYPAPMLPFEVDRPENYPRWIGVYSAENDEFYQEGSKHPVELEHASVYQSPNFIPNPAEPYCLFYSGGTSAG